MLERTTWENGPHRLEFEPPDVYHVRILAPVTPGEGLEVVRVLNEEILPLVSDVYVLIDLSAEAGTLSSGARKAVANVKPTWRAVAVVGGSPLGRAVMNMTLRAFTLISGQQAPTRMVKTVEEAHAFFDEVRAALRLLVANG